MQRFELHVCDSELNEGFGMVHVQKLALPCIHAGAEVLGRHRHERGVHARAAARSHRILLRSADTGFLPSSPHPLQKDRVGRAKHGKHEPAKTSTTRPAWTPAARRARARARGKAVSTTRSSSRSAEPHRCPKIDCKGRGSQRCSPGWTPSKRWRRRTCRAARTSVGLGARRGIRGEPHRHGHRRRGRSGGRTPTTRAT